MYGKEDYTWRVEEGWNLANLNSFSDDVEGGSYKADLDNIDNVFRSCAISTPTLQCVDGKDSAGTMACKSGALKLPGCITRQRKAETAQVDFNVLDMKLGLSGPEMNSTRLAELDMNLLDINTSGVEISDRLSNELSERLSNLKQSSLSNSSLPDIKQSSLSNSSFSDIKHFDLAHLDIGKTGRVDEPVTPLDMNQVGLPYSALSETKPASLSNDPSNKLSSNSVPETRLSDTYLSPIGHLSEASWPTELKQLDLKQLDLNPAILLDPRTSSNSLSDLNPSRIKSSQPDRLSSKTSLDGLNLGGSMASPLTHLTHERLSQAAETTNLTFSQFDITPQERPARLESVDKIYNEKISEDVLLDVLDRYLCGDYGVEQRLVAICSIEFQLPHLTKFDHTVVQPLALYLIGKGHYYMAVELMKLVGSRHLQMPANSLATILLKLLRPDCLNFFAAIITNLFRNDYYIDEAVEIVVKKVLGGILHGDEELLIALVQNGNLGAEARVRVCYVVVLEVWGGLSEASSRTPNSEPRTSERSESFECRVTGEASEMVHLTTHKSTPSSQATTDGSPVILTNFACKLLTVLLRNRTLFGQLPQISHFLIATMLVRLGDAVEGSASFIKEILADEQAICKYIRFTAIRNPFWYYSIVQKMLDLGLFKIYSFLQCLHSSIRVANSELINKICGHAAANLQSVMRPELRSDRFGKFEFLKLEGFEPVVNLFENCLSLSCLCDKIVAGCGLPGGIDLSKLSGSYPQSGSYAQSVGQDSTKHLYALVELCIIIGDYDAVDAIIRFLSDKFGKVDPRILKTILLSTSLLGKLDITAKYYSLCSTGASTSMLWSEDQSEDLYHCNAYLVCVCLSLGDSRYIQEFATPLTRLGRPNQMVSEFARRMGDGSKGVCQLVASLIEPTNLPTRVASCEPLATNLPASLLVSKLTNSNKRDTSPIGRVKEPQITDNERTDWLALGEANEMSLTHRLPDSITPPTILPPAQLSSQLVGEQLNNKKITLSSSFAALSESALTLPSSLTHQQVACQQAGSLAHQQASSQLVLPDSLAGQLLNQTVSPNLDQTGYHTAHTTARSARSEITASDPKEANLSNEDPNACPTLTTNEVAYGIALDALVNNGKLEEAVSLINELKQSGKVKPNTIMYTTLIKGFGQRKQLDRAMMIYRQMVEENVERNTVTYNSIIDACARVGNMKETSLLLEEMIENGFEPDLITFSTIIKGYCVQSNMDESFQLLGIMYKRGIKPDSILYNSLLEGCVRSGRLWLCEKLWEQMQQHGIKPSNFTLTILIKMYGRSGQLNKVFDLVSQIPMQYGFNINAHVYTCLMSACITNAKYKIALQVYWCMKENGVKPDAKTLQTCILATSKGGLYAEFLEIINELMGEPGGVQLVTGNIRGLDGLMRRAASGEGAVAEGYRALQRRIANSEPVG